MVYTYGMSSGMNGLGKYLKYAIAILVIVILVLSFFFLKEYVALRRAQIISARELRLSAFLQGHGPLTAGDVGVIRSWMTFGYINTIFKVPPAYLKNALSISDAAYPQLSLYGYADKEHLSAATVTGEVQTALFNYLTASSTN